MCTNNRWIINKYTGERVLVKCGHCPSCLQEKAQRNVKRIKFEHNKILSDGNVQMFITLTYASGWCPYVKVKDLVKLFNTDVDACQDIYTSIPIYRDSSIKRGFGCSMPVRGQVKLCDKEFLHFKGFDKKRLYTYFNKYHLNEKFGNGKVGVIYYKDLQDFEKRLKINCKRLLGFDKIRFFNASEYGETTCRPHFHILATVPPEHIEGFRRCLRKSWIYGVFPPSCKRDQIARDCANYVSSYVNSPTDTPAFLTHLFPPKSSFSQFYGYNNDTFSFNNIKEMVYKGDLHLPIFFDKQRENYSLRLVPAHVIFRYFPKFKGLSRLSPSEVSLILRFPKYYKTFAERLELTDDDVKNGIQSILRSRIRCNMVTSDCDDLYADLYARAWRVWSCSLLKDFYQEMEKPHVVTEMYDNLSVLPANKDIRYSGSLNPNNQCWRRSLTQYYSQKYNKNQKQRKVNYFLYNEL